MKADSMTLIPMEERMKGGRNMKRRSIERGARAAIAASILLALCAGSLAAQDSGKKAGAQRLLPDYFLREYDPVTMFFSEDRGPDSGGPADDASALMSVSPSQPGEYRWLDARTLQFLPADPWPALKRFTFKGPGLSKTLSTLMAPPSSISPSPGSANLGSFTDMSLSFSQPMDVDSLREMISLEVRSLPGLGSQEVVVLGKRDFSLKEIERSDRKSPSQYRLILAKPIGDGKSITLRLKLSLDESIPGSLTSYVFSTRTDFRLTSFGSGSAAYPVSSTGSSYPKDQAINCGTGQSALFLEFSESLDRGIPIEALKRMIKFEPAVRNLRFEFSGSKLFLYFDRDTETAYRLSVGHERIKSASGRELSPFSDSGFYFYYKALSPFVSWKAGQGILERYGAQSFPMQGRGIEKVDLRIYAIKPDSLDFWPFPSGEVAVSESERPPMPGEEPSYGTELRKQIRLLGSPEFSEVVSLPSSEQGPAASFGIDLAPYLKRMKRDGKSGAYLVGYRLLGNQTERHYVRVQVTDLCLTTVEEERALVFAVTSLDTGKPVPGAEIRLEGLDGHSPVALVSGRTDKDGRFRYEHRAGLRDQVQRVAVSTQDDYLCLDPNQAPPYFHNNHWFGSGSAWLSWLSMDARAEAEKPRRRAYAFSERPIYRAEEPVHIQGFVRLREKGLIKGDDPRRKRTLYVTSPSGKEYSYPVAITGNGYFYKLFEEPELPTGTYRVRLHDDEDGTDLAAFSFAKEAYRVPSFEVNLSGPDKVPFDKPFDILLSASYYSGGKVAGQNVEWDLGESAYSISPAAFPGYAFSSYVNMGGAWREDGSSSAESQDVTDDSGSARLTVDPRTAQSIQPRAYHVQAYVRGADAQTVAASKTVLALPPFVIGLKLPRFETEKQSVRPSVIVLDHEENPLAGKQFTLRLYERQWHSYLSESDISTGAAKYVSDVVDSLVSEKAYVSQEKPLDLDLPVKSSGVYVVEVQGRDELGRLQSVKRDLFVEGADPMAWKKTTAAVFETSLGKAAYEPGDVAELLIQSPFQEASAFVVIEKPSGNEYRWADVKNGQAMLKIPVSEELVPRFPVHTILMRGRLRGSKGGFQSGQDRFRPLSVANTTWIAVDPSSNRLKVSLEHETKTTPGAKFKIKVRVTDRDGKPMDGEVALWLVDRAVLALAPERFNSPLDAFIDPVEAAVRISDSRNLAVGNLPFEEVPGGDMAEAAMMKGLLDRTTVRKNFKTVPYFNPAVKVVGGIAEVSFTMPDNLTDFAVRAIATSGYDKFGVARSMVSLRLPVLAQEALPRFFRPGDLSLAGAIGRVVEGPGGKGRAEVKLGGLRLSPSGKQGDTFPIDLDQAKATPLYFLLQVPPELAGPADGTVSFTIGVERLSDSARDAFSLDLPLRQDNVVKRSEARVEPEAGKEYSFPQPKEKARDGSVTQTAYLVAQGDLMRVLSALRFQQNYEYGCTEQRVSKAYPVLALGAALGQAGLPNDFALNEPYLKGLLSYLEGVITPSGLYSFYPGSEGSVYLTAYVVEFLSTVRKAGVAFSPVLLSRPTDALREALRSDYDHFTSGYSLMERSLALCALDSIGDYQTAYAQELLALAQNADLYTQARVYLCLSGKKGVNSGQLRKIEKSLGDGLVFKKQSGKLEFVGLQQKADRRSGPFFYNDLRETALAWSALSRAKYDETQLKAVLDYLLAQAGEDGWGDTYTNTCVLLTLADYIGSSKSKKAGAAEYYDGKAWKAMDSQGKPFAKAVIKADALSKLRMKSMDAKNPPTLFMVTEYVPGVLGSEIRAQSSGFSVERELVDYGKGGSIVKRWPVKVGAKLSLAKESVVEDHVRVLNPEDRAFVAIRVPLASGFEPMNPKLAGSVKEAVPAGRLTLEPAYADYEDNQVTFYYNKLPAGSYDFYFRVRANFEGVYVLPPAKAQALYDLRTSGISDGASVNVVPAVEK